MGHGKWGLGTLEGREPESAVEGVRDEATVDVSGDEEASAGVKKTLFLERRRAQSYTLADQRSRRTRAPDTVMRAKQARTVGEYGVGDGLGG